MHLLDLDLAVPAELRVELPPGLVRRRALQIFVSTLASLAAPLERGGERSLRGAVHRRGVDAARAGVEGRADDLVRELLVRAERVPGAEPDDRAEAALLHATIMPMRVIRPSSEAEMVALFLARRARIGPLRAHVSRSGSRRAAPARAGSRGRESERGSTRSCSRSSEASSPARGSSTGSRTTLRWDWASLTPDEVLAVHYIEYDYWIQLSGGSRQPLDAADRLRAGITVFRVPNDGFFELAGVLGTARLPQLILVGSDEGRLVVLEGHARLTAYALRPEALPPQLEVLLGRSPGSPRGPAGESTEQPRTARPPRTRPEERRILGRPRPMCASGSPAHASSQPSPSAASGTVTIAETEVEHGSAWCETPRWRSRWSASGRAYRKHRADRRARVAAFAASASESAPWPSRVPVPTIPGPTRADDGVVALAPPPSASAAAAVTHSTSPSRHGATAIASSSSPRSFRARTVSESETGSAPPATCT